MINKANTGRVFFVALVLLAAFGGLAYRLVDLHLGSTESARDQVVGPRHFKKELVDPRGRIYDASGSPLALDIDVKDVLANPDRILQTEAALEDVVALLSPLLQMEPDALMARLNRPGDKWEPLKRRVTADVVSQIQELNIKGIFYEDVSTRYYPHDQLLCHALGFVNHEGVGSSGVEQQWNKFLRGCPGLVAGEVDGRRKEIYDRRQQYIEPRDGSDVYLTIDQNIQYFTEMALDEVMKEFTPKAAWAIVQHVRTGEILAMASRPDFNLNSFNSADDNERRNRPIADVYDPGSTMKIVTYAAAIDLGVVTPRTIIDCENGCWYWKGRPLRSCHPYDRLTAADGLQKSDNIAAAKVAIMMGDRRFHGYLSDFGFGSRLGLDLPGEEGGILHPWRKWSGISSSRLAIGQGISVTSLQMLGAMCAIANEGVLMKPYIVRRVVDADNTVMHEARPEQIKAVVSADTAAAMLPMLVRVTEDGGTARRARVDGYKVAGKTGTAQKVVNGRYSDTAHFASFVGVAPADDPEIGIIVVVDEPHKSNYGGVVAAPAFSKIASQTLRYLDIAPAAEDYRNVARM